MNRWKLGPALLLSCALIFSGCGKSSVEVSQPAAPAASETKPAASAQPAAPAVSDRIVYGLFVSPSGMFNPILSDSDYDLALNDLIFSTLLQLDNNRDLIPGLAESYHVSEDNRTITFQLRSGVLWHDGQPFSAKDVAFTFNTMARKDYDGPLYGDVEDLVGAQDVHDGKAERVEGIKVVDENTISFTYNKVFAPGLVRIGTEVGIIPEHIWSKVPVDQWKKSGDILANPVGTGPYRFKEFVPGQHAELTANPQYFDGEPTAKTFVFRITNQDTAVAAMANGEIDIADVSNFKGNDIQELEKAGIKLTSFPGKSYQYMGFNLREKKLQDKNLRQALTYAIDRKTLLSQLVGKNATLINAPMLPNSWQYPSSGLNEYPYDPQKAKELLQKAGYEDKNKDGILEDSAGKKLILSLKYPIGNKIRESYSAVIKKYLNDVGIEVDLKSMEFAALLDEVMTNHEFDLFLLGSSLSLDPDPTPYWGSKAASDEKGVAGWNIPGYRSEEADRLMAEGLNTLDQSKRLEAYTKFSILYNEDSPIVLLYAPNIVKAYNPKLQNYAPTTFVDYYQVTKWFVEK